MFPHDGRRDGAPAPVRHDDGQIGPDSDEWTGEQLRRLDDTYRSWRGDRYRRRADDAHGDSSRDGAPSMPPTRGRPHGR